MRIDQAKGSGTSSARRSRTALEATGERCDRKPVALSGHVTAADGTNQEVTLFDLSYEGCFIIAPSDLTPGQRVQLSVSGRGAIEAEVRWYSQGKAGLAFDTESEPAEARAPRKPRCSARVPVGTDVVVRHLRGTNQRVRAFDLSSHGCRLEMLDRPSVDEPLFVKFPGLEAIEAQVCWVDGEMAGLRFAKPIYPAVLELLMERLGGA